MAEDARLYLIAANKSRPSRQWWYDVRDGSPDGPVVGRIYKQLVAPTGKWWW